MTLVFTIMLFVRGALVLALALLACRLLRRAAASLRYVVLASALAAVLVLPVLTALVPAWHTAALPAFATATPSAAETPALPIAETAVPAPAPAQVVPPPAERAPLPWGAIAGAVWAAGVALLLARAAVGALRARRIAARGTPSPEVAPYVAEAWRAVGGRGAAPRVVTSAEIEAPIVVGAVAPVVVVPRASASWDAERWRVVLLHELAHVQRRDGLANLVAQIACSVHWPDPFAWLAARRLREERELAADDAVLRGGARASSYAEHLVAIAASASYAPAAALAMAHPSRFEARVVALLDGARSHRAIGARRTIAVAALVAGVAGAVACVSPDGTPSARAEEVGAVPSAAPAAPTAPTAPTRPAATDPAIQSAAAAELDRVMTDFHPTGAIAIVLEAKTGAIVALATRGDGDARRARTPGSTLKPFAFAAALDAGVVAVDARIDCENGTRKYGAKTMTDASPHGVLDLGAVLAVSSNVCTAKIAEPLGDRLGAAFRRYHLPAPAHVDTRTIAGASIASGEGVPASALDVATAYTAFADDGVYHAPGVAGERVMTAETARAVRAMMVRVVEDAEGTGQAARVEGVRVAGKTGTAPSGAKRNYASFVGIVPADAPRFVVLVGADGVEGQGGKVAAPAFAAIAARALAVKR
jgi:beta-lactamase regulating signal transducer with metallopeptidase domain